MALPQILEEVNSLFTEACEHARGECADELNQAVRRIRQAADADEIGATLLDAAARFATGVVWFRISGETATGERIRGVPEEAAEAFHAMEIPLASAAALAGAVESRDPVIAVTTPPEISEDLAKLLGHPADGRVSIFPIVVRDRVPALLYAWGSVQGPAVELLTQVAAAAWSALRNRPVSGWDGLPLEEQRIHLRAQRFARVQVAQMRLFQADAVQAGRGGRNLYDALRKSIDAARETYRPSFFAPCSSMVDYLHLELVQTLANDDPDLLGENYPGPLV
ncbi:MAG TPA: GAF domain-containing protein [Bryobacteraceae bacterium]|nr:GAF domain-containing protein [Bryobacteraceae bacterium]